MIKIMIKMGDMWYCPQPAIGQIQKKNRINFLMILLRMESPHPVLTIEDLYRCTTVVKYIVHLPGVDELWPSAVPKFPVDTCVRYSCRGVAGRPCVILSAPREFKWWLEWQKHETGKHPPIAIKTIEYIRYRYRCMSYILELINIHIISILYIHVWSHRG